MTRKILLSVIILAIFTVGLFGSPPIHIGSIIEESKIPMPEVHYELPEALIGEFTVVSRHFDIKITIFPNNKYIILLYAPFYLSGDFYGYIVKDNDKIYFSPPTIINRYRFFQELTEIHLTDSGFFFYTDTYSAGDTYMRAIRKENVPVPERLTEDISVPYRTAKEQYFSFDGLETDRIDFNEIEYLEQQYLPVTKSWYHYLRIDNGIVDIFRFINDEDILILYTGFLEITEKSDCIAKGLVRFTNGGSYYYINDGTAEIEINSDGSIKITMLYSPDQYVLNDIIIPDELEFPARLILEF